MPRGAGGFGDQLESQTNTYLDRLDDCVDLLPELLDRYEADEEYSDTVERIQTIESECDRINRDIIALITNADPSDMGLLNTRINYNQSALIQFYKDIDTVANLTERIAQELVMMGPPHDTDCFEGLREMAREIAEMTVELGDVVERFVHNLCTTNGSDTLAEAIQSIRDAESRCDEIRNDVIATAFDDDGIDQPLMYREFAILFDELANKIEDITDQIITIASNDPGLVTESGSQD